MKFPTWLLWTISGLLLGLSGVSTVWAIQAAWLGAVHPVDAGTFEVRLYQRIGLVAIAWIAAVVAGVLAWRNRRRRPQC